MMTQNQSEANSRQANYYVRTRNNMSWDELDKEMNKAAEHNSLIVVHITDIVDLLVNTDLRGKTGDVVMWIDDDANEHIDKLTSSVRPAHVIGKVEEVITKVQ